ncbi:conserved hypothetical protein [Ricinus communis]|uniref:Uncharacterized protein n=1 Tax=Ricinus communis TaxID=3988 RepID=B9RN58_RICCO|nr:conserved hypothetical protein [Ricinus communis]
MRYFCLYMPLARTVSSDDVLESVEVNPSAGVTTDDDGLDFLSDGLYVVFKAGVSTDIYEIISIRESNLLLLKNQDQHT